jgi:hypothetical protein
VSLLSPLPHWSQHWLDSRVVIQELVYDGSHRLLVVVHQVRLGLHRKAAFRLKRWRNNWLN